jgi:hypothetical protein
MKPQQKTEERTTFTQSEVEEWSARQWIGLSLVNIYERFGNELTPTEIRSITGAIRFFIPGWEDQTVPQEEPVKPMVPDD